MRTNIIVLAVVSLILGITSLGYPALMPLTVGISIALNGILVVGAIIPLFQPVEKPVVTGINELDLKYEATEEEQQRISDLSQELAEAENTILERRIKREKSQILRQEQEKVVA